MQGVDFTRSWSGAEVRGRVHPRFYMEPVQDEVATAREGRPIFHEEERVEIFIPGDPLHRPVARVTDEHRNLYPEAYEKFRKGLEDTPDGTPLEEWPVLNRGQVLELKGLNFRTVEDLAHCADNHAQNVMGLRALKLRAIAYLDAAAEMAQNEQLSADNTRLTSEVSRLQQQVEELGRASQQMFAELAAMKSAPNPLATMIPGMADPLQAHALAQAAQGLPPTLRQAPESSLSAFAERESAGRRPGRPRKAEAA
jgi:hypothetical protein